MKLRSGKIMDPQNSNENIRAMDSTGSVSLNDIFEFLKEMREDSRRFVERVEECAKETRVCVAENLEKNRVALQQDIDELRVEMINNREEDRVQRKEWETKIEKMFEAENIAEEEIIEVEVTLSMELEQEKDTSESKVEGQLANNSAELIMQVESDLTLEINASKEFRIGGEKGVNGVCREISCVREEIGDLFSVRGSHIIIAQASFKTEVLKYRGAEGYLSAIMMQNNYLVTVCERMARDKLYHKHCPDYDAYGHIGRTTGLTCPYKRNTLQNGHLQYEWLLRARSRWRSTKITTLSN